MSLSLTVGGGLAYLDSYDNTRVRNFIRGATAWNTGYHKGTLHLEMLVDASPSRLDVNRREFAGFLWLTATDTGWSGSAQTPGDPGHGLILMRLDVPLWLPTIAGLALAVPAVRSRRRWRCDRRRRLGRCPDCGYDLRASPDRCPECGAATPCVHDHDPETAKRFDHRQETRGTNRSSSEE